MTASPSAGASPDAAAGAAPGVASGVASGIARWPWIVATFVACATAISLWPEARAALVYDRGGPPGSIAGGGAGAVAAGPAVWRALSSQLVHDASGMAAIDLGVVLLAGAFLERRDRVLAAAALVLGMLFVALAVLVAGPQLVRYEGASGVGAALFTAAALHVAFTTTSRGARALALAAAAVALAKAAVEQWSGWTWADAHLPPDVRVLPAAHLAGSLAGIVATLAWRARWRS